jgi:hypothetical protein
VSFKVDQLLASASKLAEALRPAGSGALNRAVKLANDAGALRDRVHGAWQAHRNGGVAMLDKSGPPSINDVLDDWWQRHALVTLKESTRDSYQAPLARIRTAFGHLDACGVSPAHLERYQQWRALSSEAAAKKEGSLLTSALTFAAKHGLIDYNPLKGHASRADFVRHQQVLRQPEPQELDAFCELNPSLAGYVRLKQATGLGQIRLLSIDLDKHWDGTTLQLPARRGESEFEQSDDAIAAAIDVILDGRPAEGPLFLNSRGTRVKIASFRSSFRRAMTKYVSAGGQRFCEQEIPQFSGQIRLARPEPAPMPAAEAPAMAAETEVEAEAPSAAESIAERVRKMNFADSMLMPPSKHDLRHHIHAPGG